MAAMVLFDDFREQLGLAAHNLNTDALYVALSNVGPTAGTDTQLSTITQIANGNGYTTAGQDTQNTWAQAGATCTLTGTKVVWTGAGAGMATARYVVLYNFTHANDLLIGYWDYGAGGFTLGVGETFSVKFNNSDTTGSILTLT